jgi:hypothetical protein
VPVAEKPAAEGAIARPTARKTAPRRGWIHDFFWADGRLQVRKTGVKLRLSWAVIAEIISWAVYLNILAVATAWARSAGRPKLSIGFIPDRPRRWYLVRGALMWAGLDLAEHPAQADAVFYFDDSTVGAPPPSLVSRRFNFGCTDISKSHVAQVFEEVFGYPLTVDPATATGEIVEKPEKNGVHGGRIVVAPLPARPGFAYQRVVDTRDGNGCCQDLRTPCVNGEPVVVWIKTKTPEGRFSINNRAARMADPTETYSETERRLIREFNARMGLDWGGLDILRDRTDGRIYIVDVNKTDLGPVIALSWRDKIVSMSRLAAALRRLVGAG